MPEKILVHNAASSNARPGLSVFFPCYNDAETIGSMCLMAAKSARELTDNFEIIVIDDGSTDHSAEVLRDLAQQMEPRLTVVTHPKNTGYGAALRSGFAASSREWILYTDGDAQYNIREMKNLVEKISDKVDIVQGYKIKRCDPVHRIIIGLVYKYLMKWLFRLNIRDIDCDFRLLRRSVFDKVVLHHDSGVICIEMVKKMQDAGFRFVEVGVSHYFRKHGCSQFFNFRHLSRVMINIIRLWLELKVFKPKDQKQAQ